MARQEKILDLHILPSLGIKDWKIFFNKPEAHGLKTDENW